MKAITDERLVTLPNVWGHDSSSYRQTFVIEESDVGTIRPSYLGYNHKDYKFKSYDVGRAIEILRYPEGGGCWHFTSVR
jgi:hypothetical protein